MYGSVPLHGVLRETVPQVLRAGFICEVPNLHIAVADSFATSCSAATQLTTVGEGMLGRMRAARVVEWAGGRCAAGLIPGSSAWP